MTGITSMALMGLFAWSGMTVDAQVVPPTPAPTAPKAEKTLSVRLTAYNAVAEQTDGDPHTTASGAHSNPAVIAARSQDLADELPFGTIVAFEAPTASATCGFFAVEHLVGYRVIADTMHQRMHEQVDIMFDTKDVVRVNGKLINPARALGVCTTTVRVVGKVAMKDIPKTQAELALIVNPVLAAN